MKTKTKMKRKTKIKNKMKPKTKMKIKTNFRFFFHFVFHVFMFLLSQSFCIFVNFTWPRVAIYGQLSLDWPRSAIAPRNMVPSLIQICRIQWCCSLFWFLTRNTPFGNIWYLELFEFAEFNDVHFFCPE